MKIMEILVKDAVILNLGVKSKRDVLAEMANALAKVEPQIEADRLLEVLLEREALQSTGIGEGVAIPHGKMVGLDSLVATFARSPEGVDFDSIDRVRGMQVNVITTAGTDEEGKRLLELLGMPFVRR